MKKNILLITCAFISFMTEAQAPIFPLSDQGWDTIENAYYKDTNNELDSFVGTYIHTEGATTFKIILKKQEMFYNPVTSYYEDRIVGDYQFIKDGVEIVNALDKIEPMISDRVEHLLYGNWILNKCTYMPDGDCILGEKRLNISLVDPNSEEHYGRLIIKHRLINGQQALKGLMFFSLVNPSGPPDRVIVEPDLTWQRRFILIKQ
jgi:hypothetical protein